MQNIPDDQNDELAIKRPSQSLKTKSLSKIINNRSMNQKIYRMFLQKRYNECLKLISKCQYEDQFKIYIKALVAKYQFKLEKALDYFSQCQMLDRLNFHYLKHMAKSFYLVGKFKSSLEAIKDASTINPDDEQVQYIMGKIALALNDDKNAIVHFNSSLNKGKNQASYIQKAKILIEQKNNQEALKVLDEALEFSKQNPEIYELKGHIKYQKGKIQEAIQNFKLALERDCSRFSTLLAMGTVSQALNQANQAFQYFKKAHKISPNSAILWNNIAIHMFQKKKPIAAYSCLKRALYLDPFRWDIHANLGLLFMKHQKYLQAQIHFKSAFQHKKDGVLLNLWGLCLKNLNDLKNAQLCFLEGSKLEPQNGQIKFNYVMALHMNKKIDLAKQEFKKLLQDVNDPKVKQALYQVKHLFD